MKFIKERIVWFFRVVASSLYRFYWDDCFSRASALAYTSLLALVPIFAISFSMFSIFGLKKSQIEEFLTKLINQVLPAADNKPLEELQQNVIFYIQEFSSNITALNTLSIAVLIVTGIALFNTIESALNAIWRVTSNQTVISKITNFWAVISLGSLLIAVSIYTTTRFAVLKANNPFFQSSSFDFISFVIPVFITLAALTLLFYKLPAATVRLKDAAFGALIASILFECTKKGFAYYISFSASDGGTFYNKLYAGLALLPLFLFWLYVAWLIVLLGAELAYQAGSISILLGLKKYRTQLGDMGALLGLRILIVIAEKFKNGAAPATESEIAIEMGTDPVLVRSCLDVLSKAGIISEADEKTHHRSLLTSPLKLKLLDVYNAFRSKENRIEFLDNEKDNPSMQEHFLDRICRVSERLGKGRGIDSWTLDEVLG